MKKWQKRILLAFLVIVLLVTTFLSALVFQGYLVYLRVTKETPIAMAIEKYPYGDDTAYDELSEDFVHAVVALEDQRFFERHGFDWIALIRATLYNMSVGTMVEGGSTIGQQVAKNLYYQGKSRGLFEKLAEVFIMYELESAYSKEEVLALYVSMNYYGDGYWGIKQASKGYYKLNPIDLSLAQSAILAGIPNAPAIYQLSDGYDRAKRRQKKALSRMVEEGYITQIQMNEALEEDVHP